MITSMTFEELDQKMQEKGYTRKDFKNEKHYRGWYYRNRKKVIINHTFHPDAPLTFWFKPLSDITNKSGEKDED